MHNEFSTVYTIPPTTAKIALGKQSQLHTGNLSSLVKIIDLDSKPLIAESITMRDFVRLAFAALGIDIEFSGKNENEKGVVIDIDEERVIQLGLNLDALRFGQTVARVHSEYTQVRNIDLIYHDVKLTGQTNISHEALIAGMVMAGLQQAKIGL